LKPFKIREQKIIFNSILAKIALNKEFSACIPISAEDNKFQIFEDAALIREYEIPKSLI
jgi:hypothetical protein